MVLPNQALEPADRRARRGWGVCRCTLAIGLARRSTCCRQGSCCTTPWPHRTLSLTLVQERKQKQIRALQAVDNFRNAKYDDAINAFIELDINPAKVVALYPESISGRLSVHQDEWIPLFGGPKPQKTEPPPISPDTSTTDVAAQADEQEGGAKSVESPPRAATPQGSIRNVLLKTGLESLVATAKDDDAASIRSVRRPPKPGQCSREETPLFI